MPAVNYHLMYQEMVRKTKGGFNQVLYWSRLLDWKNQTLTPNPDVIYLMPFFNTKDVGPVVLEIPPADDGLFNGSIMNYWQAAIEDVGPGGVDKGKGGKYLFLPPATTRQSARWLHRHAVGHLSGLRPAALGAQERQRCRRREGRRLFQAHQTLPALSGGEPSADDVRRCERRRVRLHHPLRPALLRVAHQMVQAEPWLERDKAMIDPLKTIGIERGKPFKPDAKTKQILNDAIQEAKAWLDASTTCYRLTMKASAGSSRPPKKCFRTS